MRVIRPLGFIVVLLFALPALAQQQSTSATPATMDAQSAALVQKARSALNGTTTVADVTLTGTVMRTAGSDNESGTITLRASGTGLSRIDMNLSGGTWSELRGVDSRHLPKSTWSGPDGTVHTTAAHNTLSDAVWFFPALSSLSKNSAPNQTLTVSYVGQEVRKNLSVYHIHFITQFPDPTSASLGQKAATNRPSLTPLTTMDMYLDAASYLPAAITFSTHADNNALVNIPVEVDFGNYQSVDGVAVPMRIQKFLNGTLFLDITVQAASINTSLSATEFTAQ